MSPTAYFLCDAFSYRVPPITIKSWTLVAKLTDSLSRENVELVNSPFLVNIFKQLALKVLWQFLPLFFGLEPKLVSESTTSESTTFCRNRTEERYRTGPERYA